MSRALHRRQIVYAPRTVPASGAMRLKDRRHLMKMRRTWKRLSFLLGDGASLRSFR